MKYEWRKQDKDIYLPKDKPVITTLKPMQYLTIKGKGNPNKDRFKDCTQTLYSLSYPIKMTMKKKDAELDYTVFPLEGIWDFSEEGRTLYLEGHNVVDLKDYLVYTLMIRQPDFVTSDFFEEIRNVVFNKKKNELVLEAKLETIEEGLVCQMLHKGSYDDEPKSFELMEAFCQQQGYKRVSKIHKEIYLSDPRKVSEEKLKTTLRFQVEKMI